MSNEIFQSLFDRMLTHLRKQGKRAMRGSQCAYRDEKGNACAVGCLIADEHYTPELEGTLLLPNATNVCLLTEALRKSGIPTDEQTLRFLHLAQSRLHDEHCSKQMQSTFREWLEKQAQSFAAKYSLTYTPIEAKEQA